MTETPNRAPPATAGALVLADAVAGVGGAGVTGLEFVVAGGRATAFHDVAPAPSTLNVPVSEPLAAWPT